MNRIDKLLPEANRLLLANTDIIKSGFNEVRKGEFDASLAGFGPAVITSGIVQTLMTYIAKGDKKIIADVIASLAKIDGTTDAESLKTILLSSTDQRKLRIWRREIIDASIALKMMIRTFKQPKEQ